MKKNKTKDANAARSRDDTNHTPQIEGHDAAVRGTSATPGEAESRDTAIGTTEGLTDHIDVTEDEDADGAEGRLGGANYPGNFDAYDTEAGDFDDENAPRRPIEDW